MQGARQFSQLFTRLLCALAVVCSVGAVQSVLAKKNGVSPSRIKLPKGPGSLEGVGENIQLNYNMGLASYGVGISLPPGRPGATPSLGLKYTSGSGNSAVGLGWSFGVSSIQRMTVKGLPVYDETDQFSAGGELVAVEDKPAANGRPASRIYRARYELSLIHI